MHGDHNIVRFARHKLEILRCIFQPELARFEVIRTHRNAIKRILAVFIGPREPLLPRLRVHNAYTCAGDYGSIRSVHGAGERHARDGLVCDVEGGAACCCFPRAASGSHTAAVSTATLSKRFPNLICVPLTGGLSPGWAAWRLARYSLCRAGRSYCLGRIRLSKRYQPWFFVASFGPARL